MSSPLIIHLSCGPASTEWAKVAGLTQKTAPGIKVSSGTLLIQDALTLAAYLYTTVPYWPEGSVFLSTIQGPIVSDEIVAVRLSNGSIILSPNNGTATLCAANMGLKDARLVDPASFGSDPYAIVRCGASLADGLVPFEELGEPLPLEKVFLYAIPRATVSEGVVEGQVFMLLKTFGNLTFTISIDEFESSGIRTGDLLKVTFTRDGKTEYEKEMTYQPSFGYVPEGDPVIFNGSSGYLDIGLNRKSFIEEALPQILEAPDPLEFHVRIEKV